MSAASSLPIETLKAEFLAQLKQQHLIVEAATGSGKSTRLPVWAASLGKVLVVQPRRIACEALAAYLSQQLSQAGEAYRVSYAIRFYSNVTEHSDIAFVTPGIALRWLAEGKLADYAVMIIDEFHERRWDSDLLLALVKSLPLRLVVTSATLQGGQLASYLPGKVLKAEGRAFPVALSYLARESHHLPNSQNLVEAVKAALSLAMAQEQGDILVFLPGRAEIQRCMESLTKLDAQVLALHASITAEQRQIILDSSNAPRPRRVILATNVAETSLTIPRIGVVIDSGLERRTQQRAGRTVLSLARISRASAEQRRGRAGRVQAGHCYRLWGEFAPLENVTPPQMQREELLEPVLFAASCGKALAKLSFLEALPAKSLQLAQQRLQQMQALEAEDGLSAHGQRLLNLPIDSYFSHLVELIPSANEKAAMLDLAAALSINQRLVQKPSGELALKHLSQWQPLHCDMAMLLDLLRGRTWPEELNVNREALSQAQELAEQLRAVMGLDELAEAQPYQRDKLLGYLVEKAPELVYVRRERRPQAMTNGHNEIELGRDSLLADEQAAALVFDIYSLPGRGHKQLKNIGLCMAPLSFSLLQAKQLGELVASGELDSAGRQCMQRVYAGRVIASEQHHASPEQCRQALVQQLLAQQLPDFQELNLAEDIEAWNLWVSLGEKHGGGEGELVELEAWLLERLQQLGVEQVEDMQLLEPQDLQFAGIPSWLRSDFDQRYPRHLVLADLKLDVEYLGRSKQVIAHYHSGGRKAGPKRWELPIWSGWRVYYKKASKRLALS